MTSYVKTDSRIQKRHSIWNVSPTNQKSLRLPVQKIMAHYVIFTDFFEVTWRKKITSYVKTDGSFQKRICERNHVLPPRSLYDFRFKSYGPLCDFHKNGDLDLDFHPISKKKNLEGPWTSLHQLSKNQDDRSSGVACRSRTDGQTDERALRECILCKIGLIDWVDLPCGLTVIKVKEIINWS